MISGNSKHFVAELAPPSKGNGKHLLCYIPHKQSFSDPHSFFGDLNLDPDPAPNELHYSKYKK
jgi:hypothetical protein